MGVEDIEDIAADQAAVSASAITGRRRTLGPFDFRFGLWDRPKKPELRRTFLSLVKVSSEGVREWDGGRGGDGVIEDGLKTLRLFLRSFLPSSSAMVMWR